jgi:tRNA threonylcarbamoyladenosine biosynthesis protein TsaE
VIALIGPLGAGKTAFVQGLAEGLGLDSRRVSSPTFVIASEYPLPDGRRLAHVDLYRVEHEGELEAAGYLDLLTADAVLAIEWADRLPSALPADRLEVRLTRTGASDRELHARATGPASTRLLEAWQSLVEAEPTDRG